jgi:hypothetical protein
MGCAAARWPRSSERHALQGWWIMFTNRAHPIRAVRYGRGAARVARLVAPAAAARPSRGYVGVWRQNPASGRLELRWQPAPESPLRWDVADMALKAAA